MNYGAYYRRRQQEIIWLRTSRLMKKGFYHRHTRRGEPPDVCISESVPALIMKVYPWINEAEATFQHETGNPWLSDEGKSRVASQMTDQLVQRLDSNNDEVWTDEPHWVKDLQPD